MPKDGLSQLSRALLVSAPGWGLQNPRGDQDVTPGGFDASEWSTMMDPSMEQTIEGPPGIDPQMNVDRWLGILLDRPRRI